MPKRYNSKTRHYEDVPDSFSSSMPEVQAAQRFGYSDAWHNPDGSINSMLDSATRKRVGFKDNLSPRQSGTSAKDAPLVTSTGGPVSDAALRLADKPTGAQANLDRAPGYGRTPDVTTRAPIVADGTSSGKPTSVARTLTGGGAQPEGIATMGFPDGFPSLGGSAPAPAKPPASTASAPASAVQDAHEAMVAATRANGPLSTGGAPVRAVAPAPATTSPAVRASLSGDLGPAQSAQLSREAQAAAGRAYDVAHPTRDVTGFYGKVGPSVAQTLTQPSSVTATPGGGTVYANGQALPTGTTATALSAKPGDVAYTTTEDANAPSYTGGEKGKFVGPDETARIARVGADKASYASAGAAPAVPTATAPAAATPGAPKPATLDTESQKAIVAAYPEISNEGSYANTAFLHALKPGVNTADDAQAALRSVTAPPQATTPSPLIAQAPRLTLPAPNLPPNTGFGANTPNTRNPDRPSPLPPGTTRSIADSLTIPRSDDLSVGAPTPGASTDPLSTAAAKPLPGTTFRATDDFARSSAPTGTVGKYLNDVNAQTYGQQYVDGSTPSPASSKPPTFDSSAWDKQVADMKGFDPSSNTATSFPASDSVAARVTSPATTAATTMAGSTSLDSTNPVAGPIKPGLGSSAPGTGTPSVASLLTSPLGTTATPPATPTPALASADDPDDPKKRRSDTSQL